jgi:hypothetical protein
MRRLILLAILAFAAFTSSAQSIDELNKFYSESRNPFVKPERLDGIMHLLRNYEQNRLPDQDSIMLAIYKSVSSAYVANNHFKQGYQVFNRYLSYKENILAENKASALNKAASSVTERARNDESDHLRMQHQLSELKADNTKLNKRLVVYKSNFALILIILSVVFAVILAGYGIRSFSLRSRLNQNRDTMKDIHHLALTGQYEDGVRNALHISIQNVETEITDIKRQFNLK